MLQNLLHRNSVFLFVSICFLLAACKDPSTTESPKPEASIAVPKLITEIFRLPPARREPFTQDVGDRVFFKSGSTKLDKESKNTIDRQAKYFKDHPEVTITLEGHTDDQGLPNRNLRLSLRRAIAVKNRLLTLGISPKRIKTVGFGDTRPAVVCPRELQQCWAAQAQNRRVVAIID